MREQQHRTMKLALPQTILTLVAASLSLQCASALTIAEQLESWKKEIEQEETSIGAKFELKPARVNQQKAFENGGVEWSQRYAESWGGWIYMDWSSAANLHSRLIRGLRASLMANRPSQRLSEASMNKHRDSMKNFRWKNGKIRRLLKARIEFNVQRGLESDKAHQAHLAYVAANMAKDGLVADAMKTREEYHNKRADEWAKFGAQTSRMIRQLGGTKTIDRVKLTKAYKALIDLAKTGILPEKTVATNGSQE